MHPRRELAAAEGLREIVVGADGEADHEIGLGVACREHEDGNRPLALDLLAHLEPVETRQHEIEDDEVGTEAGGGVDAGRSVERDLDREPFAAEAGGDRLGDRGLVLHHQDRSCTGRGVGRRGGGHGHGRPCYGSVVCESCPRCADSVHSARFLSAGYDRSAPERAEAVSPELRERHDAGGVDAQRQRVAHLGCDRRPQLDQEEPAESDSSTRSR